MDTKTRKDEARNWNDSLGTRKANIRDLTLEAVQAHSAVYEAEAGH